MRQMMSYLGVVAMAASASAAGEIVPTFELAAIDNPFFFGQPARVHADVPPAFVSTFDDPITEDFSEFDDFSNDFFFQPSDGPTQVASFVVTINGGDDDFSESGARSISFFDGTRPVSTGRLQVELSDEVLNRHLSMTIEFPSAVDAVSGFFEVSGSSWDDAECNSTTLVFEIDGVDYPIAPFTTTADPNSSVAGGYNPAFDTIAEVSAAANSGIWFGFSLSEPITTLVVKNAISSRCTLTFDDFVLNRVETSGPCLGDANGDQSINVADFIAVLLNFGNSGEGGIPGDANDDGSVNVADFIAVLLNFGQPC